MTAGDLITELQRRGVRLERRGDRIRFQPGDRVPPEMRSALAAHKAEILELLPERQADPVTATLTPGDTPAGWRIFSHRLGRELWVAADADGLKELIEDGVIEGLPAILAADVVRLRELDDLGLTRALDALAAMPGARIEDVIRGGAKP